MDSALCGAFVQDEAGLHLPRSVALVGMRDHMNSTHGSTYRIESGKKKRKSGFTGMGTYNDGFSNEEWYHKVFAALKERYRGAFVIVAGDPPLLGPKTDEKLRAFADQVLDIAHLSTNGAYSNGAYSLGALRPLKTKFL